MRYLPHSPNDQAAMLKEIGAASLDDLFAHIPSALREKAHLDLPDGVAEMEVDARLRALAAKNNVMPGFAGAGCYNHYVPAVVAAVLARPEFATAYTPYQPEVSQGTLQAVFEFQTYGSILTGLDVANASMYDGASAFAEALLMALRLGRKRDRLIVSAAIHPEYLDVARTYLAGFGRGSIVMVGMGEDGRIDAAELAELLDDNTAAVCLGYPNFVGVVEDVAAVAALAHDKGALVVTATSEALALGLLQSPGAAGADIAVAEGMSFGLSMSYGGPGLGIFATRREYVRQMPGRLVGQTEDELGRRGYVLTLATREQHIRREKATSNICTNQGLAALAATVYMGLAGRRGLRELALANARAAHELAERLDRELGLRPAFSGPFFNEFALKVPACTEFFDSVVARGVIPGVIAATVGEGGHGLGDILLIAVTERNSSLEADVLIEGLRRRCAA